MVNHFKQTEITLLIMKTLEKTMTEFVMGQNNFGMEVQSISHQQSERTRRFHKTVAYAKILSTPLTLGMFIPVDEDGNVLEEPNRDLYKDIDGVYDERHWEINNKIYQKALSNILFEGFEVDFEEGCVNPFIDYSYPIAYLSEDGKWVLNNFKTIEDLIPYKLKLTDNFKL